MLLRLVEHLNYHKIRCEIPPQGGTHQKNPLILGANLLRGREVFTSCRPRIKSGMTDPASINFNIFVFDGLINGCPLWISVEFFGVEFGGAAKSVLYE